MDDFLRIIFGGYLIGKLGEYIRKSWSWAKSKLGIISNPTKGESWGFESIDQYDEFKNKVIGVITLFALILLIVIIAD